MILSLDNLASRYHQLPSQALATATTFDLYVLDVSSRWVKYQQGLADGTVERQTPKLTQDEMLAMIKKVKETA